jgi:hypothetical protein
MATRESKRRPLVSNASTLVLSVFLIAAAILELAADDSGPYVLACGLTGLLAYLGLEAASERRSRQAVADREADACLRLKKHLTTPMAPLPLSLDRDPLADFFGSSVDPVGGKSAPPKNNGPQAG